MGVLLYHLASKIKPQIIERAVFVAESIALKKLDTGRRVDAALDYLLGNLTGELNIPEFEEACGVGIVVTPEEIEAEVEKFIEKHKNEINEKRYESITPFFF